MWYVKISLFALPTPFINCSFILDQIITKNNIFAQINLTQIWSNVSSTIQTTKSGKHRNPYPKRVFDTNYVKRYNFVDTRQMFSNFMNMFRMPNVCSW